MLNDRQLGLAAGWLIPNPALPWSWDAGGEAIVWEEGKLIVFREELRLIVERCTSHGLPPAGPLLLVLAACRRDSGENWLRFEHLLALAPDLETRETCRQLGLLADLPPAIIGKIPGRAALVRHLFAEVPPVDERQTAAVTAFFREELPIGALLHQPRRSSEAVAGFLEVLADPLRKFAPQVLSLLCETGVEKLPGPAEVELPELENAGRASRKIEDDPEFSPIFRVARDVMAAVSLPDALAEPDEELLGGVSDIGNRGPLHRLLLSELAHDDDTLAIRLALNEALFLRREPTSQQPPGSLVLLLDTGLRMWGTPRVFAVSTALAFLAKAPKHVTPAVFRSQGNAVASADLQTREGLIAQLAALDPALHAGPSLAALAHELEGAGGQLDLVIITHFATVEDADFLASLDAFPDTNIFLAALDREGRLAVRLRTAHGARTLTEARIDLRNLHAPPPDATPPKSPPPRVSGSLPAILMLPRLPFFLSPPGKFIRRCALSDGRRAFLTDAGEVWIYRDQGHGAQRWLTEPVSGAVLFFGPDQTEGRLAIVAWRASGGILEIHSEIPGSESLSATQRHDTSERPAHLQVRGGVLYLGFSKMAQALDIESGRPLGTLAFAVGQRAVGGRYLLSRESAGVWSVAGLGWNGVKLLHHTLAFVSEATAARLLLVFDRSGKEVPWAADSHGEIFPLEPRNAPRLRTPGEHLPVREVAAAHCGDRLLLRASKNLRHMTDLTENDELQPCLDFAFQEQMIEKVGDPVMYPSRVHFTHIWVNQWGAVMLRTDKGGWTEIRFLPERNGFRLEDQSKELEQQLAGKRLAFRPFRAPSEMHLTLKVADWPDGSRAFLDSRGMLHLQSSDAALPEVTFVLLHGMTLPAWTSGGHLLGGDYFVGKQICSDASRHISRLLQGFGNRLT